MEGLVSVWTYMYTSATRETFKAKVYIELFIQMLHLLITFD